MASCLSLEQNRLLPEHEFRPWMELCNFRHWSGMTLALYNDATAAPTNYPHGHALGAVDIAKVFEGEGATVHLISPEVRMQRYPNDTPNTVHFYEWAAGVKDETLTLWNVGCQATCRRLSQIPPAPFRTCAACFAQDYSDFVPHIHHRLELKTTVAIVMVAIFEGGFPDWREAVGVCV